MAEVHHERRGDVAILTLDRPVSNALAPSLRAELSAELAGAAADKTVSAIVLAAAGADFSTGVDIAEYDAPPKSPWISDLCRQIESSPKPVVAALKGAVLGGGFELALAAHSRIAAAGARLGLPDIALGLMPGGGATQRLPRLVGARAALDLMLSGREVGADDPRLKGFTDQIVPGDPVDAAVAAAQGLARAGCWTRSRDRAEGFRDAVMYQGAIAAAMKKRPASNLAATDIIRCVEAALLLPFDRGLDLERVRFDERRTSPDARARRHYRLAQRRAAIMPEKASGQAGRIADVLIPGSDSLVIELALASLDTGAAVTLIAEDEAETEAVRGRIAAIYGDAVDRGILAADIRDRLLEKLHADWPDGALARADLVLDIGQIDLSRHYDALRPSAIWASVSSGGRMPAWVPPALSARHVDLRVYRPAFRTKIVELGVPPGASADAVVTAAQFLSLSGRAVVRCAAAKGMVGARMSAAFFRAALKLAGAGLGPYRIDAAARALGFARGPFRLMDEEGLAVVAARLRDNADEAATSLLAERVAAGAPGWPAGRGFYIYDKAGAALHDPAFETDSTTRPDQAWLEPKAALEAALVNEAAQLVSTGVVRRASDIDVVMVAGFGFDQSRGGPLFQADLRGMLGILRESRRLTDLSPALWQPHPMVQDMVKNGNGFFGRIG